MKVVVPSSNTNTKANIKDTTKPSASDPVAPIPLINHLETPVFDPSKGRTYKVRQVQANIHSPRYEVLAIRYFSNGTCEEFLNLEAAVQQVFIGQSITTGPERFKVARDLLKGDALTTFNQALPVGESETIANWDICMNAVRRSIFPPKAARLQHKLMCQGFTKPNDMGIQQFVARMQQLNSYLPHFPSMSHTGRAPSQLDKHEFMHAIRRSVPYPWLMAMALQDFDTYRHTLEEFVAQCQRFEEMECREASKRPNKRHKHELHVLIGKGHPYLGPYYKSSSSSDEEE